LSISPTPSLLPDSHHRLRCVTLRLKSAPPPAILSPLPRKCESFRLHNGIFWCNFLHISMFSSQTQQQCLVFSRYREHLHSALATTIDKISTSKARKQRCIMITTVQQGRRRGGGDGCQNTPSVEV